MLWSLLYPHVRGVNGDNRAISAHELRFIPTCVGLMDASGEWYWNGAGSSPRTWG